MSAPTFSPQRCHGFTLVETIIVMIVMTIAAVGIGVVSSNIFDSQDDNTLLQTSVKLTQACAEQLLATHRAGAINTTCPGFNGYTTTVGSPTPYTGSGAVACPTGKTCNIYPITTTTPGGDALSPLRVMVVE